jgi:hydrogenase/urease accessory protein HupE
MTPSSTRTIRRFTSSLAITAILTFAAGEILIAHDPGLSSLEVRVGQDRITATLSLAPVDVVAVGLTNGAASRNATSDFVRDAIHLSIDDQPLPTSIDAIAIGNSGARVQLSFPRPAGSRFTVKSTVPRRAARGHRELITVMCEGERLAAQLIDSDSGDVRVVLTNAPAVISGLIVKFIGIGLWHIMSGPDHLAFLAGVLLASRRVRELVGALTAFTAAHSLTLAIAALGVVHAPAAVVEPLIAASIVYVGIENVRDPDRGPRWPLVFAFGLVHGLGFAEALRDLGLGQSAAEVTTSLLSFNIGVETGQLMVALVLMPLLWLMRSRPAWRARAVPACSVTIAVLGGYWLVSRLL